MLLISFLFFSVPRFRQNFSLIVPRPGDLYAALDACKVVDNVVFVISPPSDTDSCMSHSTSNEGPLGFDNSGEELLSAIMAQGLPSPIFVVNDIETISLKKRNDYKKLLMKQLDQMVPLEKLQVIENESDALRLLHHIGSQKQRPIYQRNMRCHFLCEEVNFKQNSDDPTVGSLIVDGYVRYQPLNVNGLVHIPGWGDFQMERIEVRREPGEFIFLEEANPALQESLKSENDPDPMNGEQTWPYQEEMEGQTLEADKIEDDEESEKKKRVPKGTSEYQAAWIKDEDDDKNEENDEEEEDDSDDWEDDYEDMSGDDGSEESHEEAEEDEMESVDNEGGDTDVYDKKVKFADEEEEFKKIKGKFFSKLTMISSIQTKMC
jgi:pre-rRNA-processing protein TSR1